MASGIRKAGLEKARIRRTAQENDEQADYIENQTRLYTLAPKQWAAYTSSVSLTWKHVNFNRASRAKVPRKPGLYAFAVQPPHADFPPSSWLFYVGEVGATDRPARTLWKRYGEYLKELDESVRPKVGRMIYKYRDFVRFYYCELDPKVVDIKAIETQLISALWPYANKNDYDAESARTKRAF